MKRITAIFLMCCLCLSLVGCGSDKEEQKGTQQTEETKQMSPEEALELAGRVVDRMTLRQKIGQMFLVDVDKLTEDDTPVVESTDDLLETIQKYQLGGVVLRNDNIPDSKMVRTLNQTLLTSTDIPMYIGTEEEGGGNKSLAANNEDIQATGCVSPREMGQSMTEEQLENAGVVIAQELTDLGFNLNLAPTADVSEAEKLIDTAMVESAAIEAIGPAPTYKAPPKKISKAKRKKKQKAYQKALEEYENKLQAFIEVYTESEHSKSCFSTDEEVTATAVEALVRGMKDGGVATALKTFPGISTVVRYHKLLLADVDTGLSRLRRVNFEPFSAGIEARTDMIMVGHVSMSKIDGKTPASLSQTVLSELLRQELQFDGIVVTEDMDVPTITKSYTTQQAVIKAVVAGADMIYNPENLEEAITSLETAVLFHEIDEKIIEQAVLRILQRKIMQGIYAPDNK